MCRIRKFIETSSGFEVTGAMRSSCLMGVEFLSGVRKSFRNISEQW